MIKRYDELWFRWKDVGIKTFCRVGSGTVSREITGAQGYELFMDAPKKVCIVRHPWKRLLSAWFGLWPGSPASIAQGEYPHVQSLEQLMAHLIQIPPDNMEVHTKPMYEQLRHFWLPKDHELVTLEAFMQNPPYGVPKPSQWHHKTRSYAEPEVDEMLKLRWMRKYSDDLALFNRAEKSPLVTGGKQATDDGHEN